MDKLKWLGDLSTTGFAIGQNFLELYLYTVCSLLVAQMENNFENN